MRYSGLLDINKNKMNKIKLAQRTISLLSSMVDGSECHTSRSIEMKTNALNGLNELDKNLLSDILNEQEEIICSPIRFNGVSVEKIKQVFEKHGIECDLGF